jgi:geranylgeranyl diphosphate synthase, type I
VSTSTSAVDALNAARAIVEPGLRAAVARLDPHLALVSSYHFGWCDPQGNPTRANSGKAVRPGLAVIVGEGVCGDPAPAVPGAVAVELIHNFSLVHDDLIDRDRERRHRETVWSVWDDTTAILAGDAMASLAHEVLADSGSPYANDAALALAAGTREVIRGQAQDVLFEQRGDVSLAESLQMAADKTGALLAVSAGIGAILAGAPAETVAAFHTFGAELGIAFQLVDDLLGVWGRTEVTGKPVFADLIAGKKTMPVVWAFEHGGTAGEELAAWVAGHDARGDIAPEELQHAADLLEKAGGKQWASDQADVHVAAALAAIEGLTLHGEARATLTDLAHFIARRSL